MYRGKFKFDTSHFNESTFETKFRDGHTISRSTSSTWIKSTELDEFLGKF